MGGQRPRSLSLGSAVSALAFSPDVRPAAETADPDSEPVLCTDDIRPLLDPRLPSEDKLDPLLRWLGAQDLNPRTCKHANDPGKG
jgi:hypothetical protein